MKKERREVRASERSGTRRQSAPGAARGDGGSSRQTGRTVTGEGRGGAGRLGQGRALEAVPRTVPGLGCFGGGKGVAGGRSPGLSN